ncbi:MAG: 7-cyano-7-deazaguanine synthase QueC [Lentisphaerae bacterium]|nr:MAG: 7-cyano-7-deazaguanine synthase QueC [Lentisphaerota bacterium]
MLDYVTGRHVVVLVSGGLDSTTLLHAVCSKAPAVVHLLSYRYGQRHDREVEMAAWQIRRLGLEQQWETLELDVFAQLAGGASTLLKQGQPVPALSKLAPEERDQPPTYVPNRNMVMLSLAAAFAEARHCTMVFYGAQAQDEYGYWDCTEEFVERLNQVFALNRRTRVRVEAPFLHYSKAQIIRLGLELGVDYAHTWSCYRGGESPCGECPTCVERANAFREVGIADPLLS